MAGMAYFAIKRMASGIVVLWAIVTIVFLMEHGPGAADPIRLILGNHFTPGNYHQLLHEYGLDLPIWQQYANYIGLAPVFSWFGIHFGTGLTQTGLLEGNLGYSYSQIGTPVWSIMSAGIPVTLKLGFYALIVSLVTGIPIGLICALKQNSLLDHTLQGIMVALYAFPTFVLVPFLQNVIAIHLGWFPVQGWGDNSSELVLPIACYAAGLAGFFAKSFRSFVLEVMQQDYIRTARAKGLQERVVVGVHAFKNTLLPLASVVGPTVAYLIVGAFIIERFFDIPGIANQTVNSIFSGDYSVIEATTIALAAFVVFVNMLTDIAYGFIDPRLRV